MSKINHDVINDHINRVSNEIISMETEIELSNGHEFWEKENKLRKASLERELKWLEGLRNEN